MKLEAIKTFLTKSGKMNSTVVHNRGGPLEGAIDLENWKFLAQRK